MNAKEIAKNIYDIVVNEGKSTDYFYSSDFYTMAKSMAKNRAAIKYEGEFLKEVQAEIELL